MKSPPPVRGADPAPPSHSSTGTVTEPVEAPSAPEAIAGTDDHEGTDGPPGWAGKPAADPAEVSPPGTLVSAEAIPVAEPAVIAPRAARADSFEQNPLSAIRAAPPEGPARLELDDGTRVREALREVIEQGESVKDAARDWNVSPSSVAEWRARYHDLLSQDREPAVPMFESGSGVKDSDLIHIPEAAREIFTENWDRLVTETAATPSDFEQSPRQIFLQTSPLTSWLFQDGQLDRGILAGAATGLVGLAILTSFLTADRNPVAVVPPPEPPPRDDLVIDTAAGVARAFLEAGSWQERLKYVRQPDAVRGMMEEYYQDHPDGPIKDAELSLALLARHVINLSFDIPSQGRSHFLCVVQSKGRHLVDWESSSIFQEAQLAKLRAARSTEPTRIAVTVTRNDAANYFNYAFRDPDQWVCYQLGYPGLKLNLFGYAARESSDALTLDAMLGIVDKHAVVMEVRFPPDSATDNQVEIVSVLRSEWVPDER